MSERILEDQSQLDALYGAVLEEIKFSCITNVFCSGNLLHKRRPTTHEETCFNAAARHFQRCLKIMKSGKPLRSPIII